MKKKIFTFIFSLLSFSFVLNAAEVTQERIVRFALWAQTDVYPGYFDSDEVSDEEKNLNKYKDTENKIDFKTNFEIPIKKIKEIAPFLIEGMVYGWKFDYTPYDKARGVPEYFEFSPINTLSNSEKERINFAKPWIEGDKLSAWVEFPRTENQIHSYYAWNSINHPRIKGVGYARLAQGFDGIKKATEEALKNAVREYERVQIKTKPKQVTGTVMISKPPLIGIDAGQYKITLDFFMESDRIIEYKTF